MQVRGPLARCRQAAASAGLLIVAALGGGCGKSQPLSLPKAQGSAQGIWLGTDSTDLQVTGLIDANERADFIRADGMQFTGTAQLTGTTLSLAVDGYSQFGIRFSSGIPLYGTGSFTGTLTAGKSISGTLSFTPAGGSATTSSWSLTASSLYDTASSLSSVSGNYGDSGAAVSDGVDPLAGASVSISTAGQMSGQNPGNDCVLNGTVTLDNTSYDLYEVSYSLASCVNTLNGDFQILNGVQFTGLADLNAGISPRQLLLAVTGQDSAGDHYGIVSQLTE